MSELVCAAICTDLPWEGRLLFCQTWTSLTVSSCTSNKWLCSTCNILQNIVPVVTEVVDNPKIPLTLSYYPFAFLAGNRGGQITNYFNKLILWWYHQNKLYKIIFHGLQSSQDFISVLGWSFQNAENFLQK